jgi:hypothetical protein
MVKRNFGEVKDVGEFANMNFRIYVLESKER